MESRIAKNVNARCGAALRRVEEIRERLGGCVRRRMAQAHMRLMNEKGCFAQKSRSCGMRSPTA